MPLLVSLQFPTGRYVAAAWNDRDQPEWPPHPARLALGLIDVLHRRGNESSERTALRWLFRQGAPWVVIPSADRAIHHVHEGVFVPQNPSSAESVQHPRKARSFPTVLLDPEIPTVHFFWPEATVEAAVAGPLGRLITALPRLGHSSSFAIISLSSGPFPEGEAWRVLVPQDDGLPTGGALRLRVPWDGLLESAEAAYDAEGRSAEREALLAAVAKKAKPDKPLSPPASPRVRHDPRHEWVGYVESHESPRVQSPWDSRLLILVRIEGDRLGLSSTLQLTETLHRTLLDRWSGDSSLGPIPGWISGHEESGPGPTGPSRHNHLALVPLPFVDSAHADGSLLGVGIALPRPETAGIGPERLRRDWGRLLQALFPGGDDLELVASDRSWRWCLRPADPSEHRRALDPTRWTRDSRSWSTVTPIVLDRHPRPSFDKDPRGWAYSCAEIVAEACVRVGLPKPVSIDVAIASALGGVPHAAAFSPQPPRPGRPRRFHIHARILFDQPVRGPLLLGAGRYRGYGMLLPLDANP